MLRAVIFDLDDTLYEYEALNKAATAALCAFASERLGVSEQRFFEAFNWGRRETKRVLGDTGASHNRLLYCQKALEYLGRPPAGVALDLYETYWGYMLEHMRLRGGAGELLAYCARRGLKMGVCTDLTAHIQHRKLRKLGLSDIVRALVTSEEVGVEKPGEAIYRMMLEKLHVLPQEAVFVGDSLEKDVVGPERTGMRAIWFQGKDDGVHRTAGSLEDVRRMLDEIR